MKKIWGTRRGLQLMGGVVMKKKNWGTRGGLITTDGCQHPTHGRAGRSGLWKNVLISCFHVSQDRLQLIPLQLKDTQWKISLQQGDHPLLTGVGWEKLSSESEDMFLTYLHIHRPPSSIAMGIGLHCSHRVEIWMILKVSGRIRKLSNSSSGAINYHKNSEISILTIKKT